MNAFGISPARPNAGLTMMLDAAHSMSWPAKLDVIRVILSDLPAAELEEFSNELGRIAHETARRTRGTGSEGLGINLPMSSPSNQGD